MKHGHMGNGWKGLDMRKNFYVEKKSIWDWEIYEN